MYSNAKYIGPEIKNKLYSNTIIELLKKLGSIQSQLNYFGIVRRVLRIKF